MQRCAWAGDDPLYQAYHDNEWGVPEHDGNTLFECLMLEGMQAGLSWLTILKRRSVMRELTQDFRPEYLAQLTDSGIDRLLAKPAMIRNRRKLQALRNNAQCFHKHFATSRKFSDWLWQFVDGKPIINRWSCHEEVPTQTEISDKMAKSLKKMGFIFVGPVICYAFMQASGLVNDHTRDCDRYGTAH